MEAGTLVVLSLAFAILAFAYVFWCTLVFSVQRRGDALYHVDTADGMRLGLSLFKARKTSDESWKPEPVILCHGLSANRFNMDFDDETSLALYLANRGFDVWVVELRGRGHSRRRTDGRKILFPTHHFDDFVDFDLPAIVDFVRKFHGVRRVHWAGHSMGGLVLYAYLAKNPDAPIRSGVTVGSPTRMFLPWWLKWGMFLGHHLPVVSPIMQSRLAILAAPWVGYWSPYPVRIVVRPESTAGHRMRTAVANLVADISTGELRQFAKIAVSGEFVGARSGFDYGRAMADVQTPILVLAGNRDLLAHPDGVKDGYERLGSAGKEFRVFGREFGDADDFGHGDLLIGNRAPEIVFPAIEGWLRRFSPAPERQAPRTTSPSRDRAVASSTLTET